MPEVEIRQLPIDSVHALAEGDLAAAQAHVAYPLPEVLVDPDWRHTWQRRSRQLQVDPEHAEWVTGLIWDRSRQQVVGKAGFHEPPDADGLVEVGYQVIAEFQRRGYGHAAMAWLWQRAIAEPNVRRVRACVLPDNAGSRRIINAAGFIQVGTEWDEDDQQWELVFERDV